MVENSDRNVVLMSIHPKFAQLILSGKKKVEFRKTRFNHQISHVVIYATSPIKKVVGYFEVQNIKVAPPKDLWESYSEVSGIEPKFFQEYYKNTSEGVAIEIGNVYQLKLFLSLNYISKSLIAPQSFIYINKDKFELVTAN